MGLGIYLAIFLIGVVASHPLDDYVAYVDPEFGYEVVGVYERPESDTTVHVLNVTSQRWMTPEFSSQPLWWHYVTIVIPNDVTIPDQAALFVGIGQTWHDPPHPEDDPFIPLLEGMAAQTGGPMTMVSGTPNQPIVFADDPYQWNRTEDAIIAWTWAKYLNTSEAERQAEMLLYFPMVKGIVRSMDAISEYAEDVAGITIDKYVVTGPSKRGWTTWLTAAVDSRVVGIAPQVLSCLPLIPAFKHHQRSLGGWSWAVEDYYREGILEKLDDPDAQILAYLQDPYEFMDRYTMPVMVVKASKDEFFMPDDTQYFFDELPGIHYMFVLENSMHIMLGHWERLALNTANFFTQVYYGYEWPDFSFDMNATPEGGTITVRAETPIVNITAWAATTLQDERRDWRWMIAVNGSSEDTELNRVRFQADDVEELGGNQYRYTLDSPDSGWTAFFITMAFDHPDGVIEFSTEVNVIPDIYPNPECEGAECKSVIV